MQCKLLSHPPLICTGPPSPWPLLLAPPPSPLPLAPSSPLLPGPFVSLSVRQLAKVGI